MKTSLAKNTRAGNQTSVKNDSTFVKCALGPPIRAWHLHRVIPAKAKILAVVMMTASFIYVYFWVADDWRLPTLLAAVMIPSGLYVVTRASSVTDSGLTSEARSPGSRPS